MVPGVTEKVTQLLRRGIVEFLALAAELFIDVDGGIDHAIVGLFGAPEEDEVFPGSDPPMALVLVQANADKPNYLR